MLSTKAFVLRAFKYGESDLIVHVLTQAGDKLKLFARGALRSRKRFGGGVLQPTHYVTLSYRETRDEGLGQLYEASIVEDFKGVRGDYDRIQLALHFVSLIDKLSLEGVDDGRPLFDLLGNALNAVGVATKLDLLKTQFELKLLYSQGILPAIPNSELLLGRQIRDGLPEDFDPEIARHLRVESESLLNQYLNR